MKKVYRKVDLTCVFQKDSELKANKCINGVLTPMTDGIRFEETVKVPAKPHTRNPKLFDGMHVSLVRKADNRVQFSFKTLGADFDPNKYADEVYIEISKALTRLVAD